MHGNQLFAQGSTAIVTYNIDNILYVDGVKYTTCDAALTAAGTTSPVIIPPGYTGPGCTIGAGQSITDMRNTFSYQASGAFTSAQANLSIQSLLNGGTVLSSNPPTGHQTENFSAATIVPSTTTVQNVDGFGAYMQSNCDSRIGGSGSDRQQCNTTGFYSQSLANAPHSAVWGYNPVVYAGANNTNLTGIEVDMGGPGNPSFFQGIVVSVGGPNTGFAPAGSTYYDIHHVPGGNMIPTYGYFAERDSTSSGIGIVLDGATLNAPTPSNAIALVGYDSSNVGHAAGISADLNGNLVLQPASGKAIGLENGGIVLSGSTSGAITHIAPANAGSNTITDPAATGVELVTGNGATPIQTKRVAGCATASAQFRTCDVTVTWTTAFVDTNYTVACTGDGVSSGVPQIEGVDISAAKGSASISVRTIALTAFAAGFSTIDCTAIHD